MLTGVGRALLDIVLTVVALKPCPIAVTLIAATEQKTHNKTSHPAPDRPGAGAELRGSRVAAALQ